MRLAPSFVIFVSIVATSTVLASHEHCDHDHADQMPLDYVKFPYEQPLYRTSSGEGNYLLGTPSHAQLPFSSDRGRYLLWYYDVRTSALVTVPLQTARYSSRYRFLGCTICKLVIRSIRSVLLIYF